VEEALIFRGYVSGTTKEDYWKGTTLFNGSVYFYTQVKMSGATMVPFKLKYTWQMWVVDHWREIAAVILVGGALLLAWLFQPEEGYEWHSVDEVDFSVRETLKDTYDKIVSGLLYAKPIPNADRPQYYAMMYRCQVPDCIMRVDAKFEKIVRMHAPMFGSDITGMQEEGFQEWGFPQAEPKFSKTPKKPKSND